MYEGVYEMLNCEIEKIEKKGELNSASLDNLDKLVDIVKDLQTIEAMADYDNTEGFSKTGRYYYDDNDMSYRRGGNYSRGYYTGRNSMRGGYSRDDGKKDMIEHLEKAMHMANSESEKEEIRHMIEKMENR